MLRVLMLLVFSLLALVGCGGTAASSAAAATGEVLSVVHDVRERACDPLLDVVFGPIQSRPCHCPMPSISTAPTTTPATPAPAPPSAPAAPAPAPVPTVAPAPPAGGVAGPAKGGGGRT